MLFGCFLFNFIYTPIQTKSGQTTINWTCLLLICGDIQPNSYLCGNIQVHSGMYLLRLIKKTKILTKHTPWPHYNVV